MASLDSMLGALTGMGGKTGEDGLDGSTICEGEDSLENEKDKVEAKVEPAA